LSAFSEKRQSKLKEIIIELRTAPRYETGDLPHQPTRLT
jgi:hypothetical protein